jgi:hypothetical protein
MAIAYDAASSNAATTNSLNVSHTTTGSDIVMVIFVKAYTTSDVVTGVKYNSVSATLVRKIQDGASRWSYMYILANPATGTNTLNVTTSSSVGLGAIVGTYTGCETSGIPDSSAQGGNSGTNWTMTTTTVADNSWLVGVWGGANTPTPSTGTTQRKYQGGAADQMYFYDSDSEKTPAGSHTLSGTQNTATTSVWIVVSLAPAGGAPATNGFMQWFA